MIEYTARITSQEPVTEQMREDLSSAMSDAAAGMQAVDGIWDRLQDADNYIDSAFYYIQSISNRISSSRVYNISTTGYVTSNSSDTCPLVRKGNKPRIVPCSPLEERPQIRVTLRSDFDQLKTLVDLLSLRIEQLELRVSITPVMNANNRKQGSTLYPQYGDWLLTSDVDEQYISFSGLSAEIGRSIYIQTRKRAYLYVNGHSFFGLTSVSDNQWLWKNTTYRFVRASSDSWLVTASSSPYPWT